MPVKVAFDARRQADAGAAEGRLKAKQAVARRPRDADTSKHDGKTESLYLRRHRQGRTRWPTALQGALDDALAKLPIPKVMSYAAPGSYYNDVKFVRPAHRLVALHGADVVAVRALDLDAGRVTGGHRFLSRGDIAIASADAYAPTLEAEGKVIPSFAARRAAIVVGLEGAAGDATPIMPDALLDEVTALVEWPVVYAGTFDAAFLDVPQECLILTMQLNQRYFALADDGGKLVNRFLLVSNMQTHGPVGDRRRQRARAARAAGRRQVLLRPGPAADARSRACPSSAASSITTSSARRRIGRRAWAPSPRPSRRNWARTARQAQRAAHAREGGPGHRHGRRIPGAAGPDGPLLRRARRRGARGVRCRSSSTTGRASPATRCRWRRSRKAWHWRTSWTRWSASGASASCPPATRIRSACAGMRSACCASCSSEGCRWNCRASSPSRQSSFLPA